MALSLTSPVYGTVARTLHWLIALAIIGMLALGWTMSSLPFGQEKNVLFQLHKSIGITILLLSLFRLFWRLLHKAPELPAEMPLWEKLAARASHILFYVLIIGMPLSGWIIVSTSSFNMPTYLYGTIHWPNFPYVSEASNKREIGHIFARMHGIAAYVMAGLIVLHVSAAQKHHWIDRDDVLTRMVSPKIATWLNRIRGIK